MERDFGLVVLKFLGSFANGLHATQDNSHWGCLCCSALKFKNLSSKNNERR
jgi:hypothetical protein